VADRYGWTMEYTMWGISFLNLHMLLADCISTYYNHEKDTGYDIINAEDPANYELTKTPDYG
jgi:hypothetical protein